MSPPRGAGGLRSTPPSALSPTNLTGRFAPPPVTSAAAADSEAEWAQWAAVLARARDGLTAQGRDIPAMMHPRALLSAPQMSARRLAPHALMGRLLSSQLRYSRGSSSGGEAARARRIQPRQPAPPSPAVRPPAAALEALPPAAQLTPRLTPRPATRRQALVDYSAAQGAWPGEQHRRGKSRARALLEYSNWLTSSLQLGAQYRQQQQQLRMMRDDAGVPPTHRNNHKHNTNGGPAARGQ